MLKITFIALEKSIEENYYPFHIYKEQISNKRINDRKWNNGSRKILNIERNKIKKRF